MCHSKKTTGDEQNQFYNIWGVNNMRKSIRIVLFLLIVGLILSGCKSDQTNVENTEDPENNELEESIDYSFDSSVSGEVEFWTFTPYVYEEVISEFNEVYPDVDVNIVGLDFGELHDKLQTTLAAGSGAPDVAHVEFANFPRYVYGDVLEDLLQPPYDAGKYEDMVSEFGWDRWKSVDGKQLLGMPWDVTPGVFYYREDLYDQVGLPSDPEELGEFLQDKDNVLMAAQTFAANDIYMFEWRDSPAIQYGDAVGYFDDEFNWMRNDDKMAELLDIVKEGIQIGWAPQMSILFDDEGKQLVNQGKVASFPVGNQAARDLKQIFPDQSGKWRATRLPLGLNVSLGGSTYVIPSQSESKDAAWAFIEWTTQAEEGWKSYAEHAIQPAWKHITHLPWYQEHTNEYLGGQYDYKFYDSLDDDIPLRKFTPLDGEAWPIYIDNVFEAVDNNIDSKTILQKIEDDVYKQLGDEIEKLKEESQ